VRYDETPITLPFNAGQVKFRAIAEDVAGNQSGEIPETHYYFAHIDHTEPDQAPQTRPLDVPISVIGFGFVGVAYSDIKMTDILGQNILFLVDPMKPIYENQIDFSPILTNAAPGTAIISITIHDHGNVVVTIPFEVLEAQ
jgi:hypothetical protein